MNLEDVIDPEYGLQQDAWSLSKPTFGEEEQLQVVGWSGRHRNSTKYYVLKCSKCSQDPELFGEGYFRSKKESLTRPTLPCGCARSPRWSQEQYNTLCSRKAKEIGYTYLGFTGEWKGGRTRVNLLCKKHGEWCSGVVHSLLWGTGCPGCKGEITGELSKIRNKKSDDTMIQSFFASGSFHPDTKFWRSDRKNKQGLTPYWYMDCPGCGTIAESKSGHLQQGSLPCACNTQRHIHAYINLVLDGHDQPVAIKFGVAQNSKKRLREQNLKSVYLLVQHSLYVFPSVEDCKKAEKQCKDELVTCVVLKRDMADGYTETTHAYNIGKVIDIYKRNGGVLV